MAAVASISTRGSGTSGTSPNKWVLLIIAALGESTLRFGELRNEIEGISHKMLTQNLRMPERNGLVSRTVHPVVPPRVEHARSDRAGPGPCR